jgi:hypothetical protein
MSRGYRCTAREEPANLSAVEPRSRSSDRASFDSGARLPAGNRTRAERRD